MRSICSGDRSLVGPARVAVGGGSGRETGASGSGSSSKRASSDRKGDLCFGRRLHVAHEFRVVELRAERVVDRPARSM